MPNSSCPAVAPCAGARLGADVSTGGNRDFSAFTVLHRDSGKIVCDYKAKIPIEEYGKILARIAKYYNNALLGVENNSGYGLLCIRKVIEVGYENIYQTVDMATGKERKTMGWTTSMKTRPLMITELMEAINLYAIGMSSRRLVDEFTTFVWNNDKAESMTGKNDDLVMATAIAWQMRKYAQVDASTFFPLEAEGLPMEHPLEQFKWVLGR